MTELDSLWAAWDECEREVKEARRVQKELGETIALLACPVKVGDVMTRRYWHGFGKAATQRIERARVVSIRFCLYRREEPYVLHGIRIRKDGTDGAEIKLWYHDNWTKEDQAA